MFWNFLKKFKWVAYTKHYLANSLFVIGNLGIPTIKKNKNGTLLEYSGVYWKSMLTAKNVCAIGSDQINIFSPLLKEAYIWSRSILNFPVNFQLSIKKKKKKNKIQAW